MTATNHAVTGMIVMSLSPNPLVGFVLAILSHFALDSLPHFGNHSIIKPGSKEFKVLLMCDGVLLFLLIIIAGFAADVTGKVWWVLPLAGLGGAMPDIMWYRHYIDDLNDRSKKWGPLTSWHKKIQRYEKPRGWLIESLWYIASVATLTYIIYN